MTRSPRPLYFPLLRQILSAGTEPHEPRIRGGRQRRAVPVARPVTIAEMTTTARHVHVRSIRHRLSPLNNRSLSRHRPRLSESSSSRGRERERERGKEPGKGWNAIKERHVGRFAAECGRGWTWPLYLHVITFRVSIPTQLRFTFRLDFNCCALKMRREGGRSAQRGRGFLFL